MALAVLVLAVGLAACGSDDSSDGDNASAQSGGAQSDGAAAEEIKTAYDAYNDNIEARRYAQACAGMAASYEKEVIKQINDLNVKKKSTTCPEAFAATYKKGYTPRRSRILSVKVTTPTTATAIVRLPLGDAKAPLEFVKEGDEWKLDAPKDQGDSKGSSSGS